MASSPRRYCVGLDGSESRLCNLSSRGLTVEQVDRTLRVFTMADTIDLSDNEIDKIPSEIPIEVVTLDISFNAIASIQGIERLQFVQELHLASNRLDDVSALEYCPRLVCVNLSGNRLMHTNGLETLENLKMLDVSENLIEIPEALRALSLNINLTHLSIRGNPLSQMSGYHLPILEIIPSLIMLDDKKLRNAVRYTTKEFSATKSISYSRIYDNKKQQTWSRLQLQTLRFQSEFSCPSPKHENAQAGHNKERQKRAQSWASIMPPSIREGNSLSYSSMYDQLAQSNKNVSSRPITPTVKPIFNSKMKKSTSASMNRLRGNAQCVASHLTGVIAYKKTYNSRMGRLQNRESKAYSDAHGQRHK
ncbi:Protein phosphatase 1, regulatory subunit, and related proteins [Plasmopara halstedii]|uniref:Protein phosphatase 1, regulatory subunit, and related proteins n=1 Tax=Plasmopara halstedii TaxID=4781 RepID=A0A0P1A886_PLAHL|nr:Protein phosphatase 1, regulatory subunit, and related proteins [Plasmopara halstedii]CEG36906.1 Protein phosphatase 1, regulatory subunit, and related proteins [Plasmopara halstedii]|eukprot:XP_024573275.1 Protein phosphatase 1, regulatory subunit, and related proteins [Plasmopara halstedii]